MSFQTIYANLSPYFSVRNVANLKRIALCTTVLGMGLLKSYVFKAYYDKYVDEPNRLLDQKESEWFYLAAFHSVVATTLWVGYEFVTQYIIRQISKSLSNDMTREVTNQWLSDRVYNYLKHKDEKTSEKIPHLITSGITEYCNSAMDYSIGGISRAIDFTTAVGSFYSRTSKFNNITGVPYPYTLPNFVFIASCITTVAITIASYCWTMGGSVYHKEKADKEQEVRKQSELIARNAQQIASRRADIIEGDELKKRIGESGSAAHALVHNNTKNSNVNWWMTDISSRALSIILAPLIFAGKASLQSDYLPILRENWQIRNFITWFCGICTTGNFANLNEKIYKARTALSECEQAASEAKKKLRFEYNDLTILQIKKLDLFAMDGVNKIKLLSISDSMDFNTGVYLLSGINGSGKTTFLNALSGISFGDTNGSISITEAKNQIYIPQQVHHKDGLTLRDLLLYPRDIKEIASPETLRDEMKEYLKAFALDSLSNDLDQRQNWSTSLSGGQKQAISIIQSLIAQPKLLLLDEVTSAMDPNMKIRAKTAIKKYSQENQAVVIHIEHSSIHLEKYYTHKIELKNGAIEVVGTDLKSSTSLLSI